MRELKAREDAVIAKEEKLAQIEAQLKEKEVILNNREMALKKEMEAFQSQQRLMAAAVPAPPAARRMSYDRVTEVMAIDDDSDCGQDYQLQEMPSSLLPATAAGQRGPVPVPMKPSFEIYDDKPVAANAAMPPAPPARYIPRKPAHSALTTGAEFAKENVNPLVKATAKNPIVLPASKENDPRAINRRPLPTEFTKDMAVESPLKKFRPSTAADVNNQKGAAAMRLGQKPMGAGLGLPPTVQVDLDALLRPRYNR